MPLLFGGLGFPSHLGVVHAMLVSARSPRLPHIATHKRALCLAPIGPQLPSVGEIRFARLIDLH
jgi:hypothetical protein